MKQIEVNVQKFRLGLTSYLDRVQFDGWHIIITRQGEVIAKITPETKK